MNELEPAIRVRGLTKTFGAFTAVDGIDVTVTRGQIFGFLGPNGSGKTTTIRMLTGTLRPQSGAAFGDDLAAVDEGQLIAVCGFVHVVGGDEQRHPASGQVVEQVPELPARDRINPGRGLVEEQQLGGVNGRRAQRQPLPPAHR